MYEAGVLRGCGRRYRIASVLDVDGFRVGVDAGLFQGSDARRGQTDFGHDPRALEALLLTHAHIDHSGRIPLLVKE